MDQKKTEAVAVAAVVVDVVVAYSSWVIPFMARTAVFYLMSTPVYCFDNLSYSQD